MFEPVIRTDRLTRYFGKRCVVSDLDMKIVPGQVTALMGLNGAGKTTTIRIIMGLLRPTRGRCEVLGEDSSLLTPETRMRIGYLVEGHFLYRNMRVSECAKFQRHGYSRWDNALFDQVVAHFGIRPSNRIGELSRGQRAGVALGLVLAPDPELLVLDDPALGLDPVSRRALNETLIEFAGDGQRTVLLSTHLLDDVERVADRVMVLVGGRLKVETTLEDFISRVSGFSAQISSSNIDKVAALPGLVEARKIGDRYQLAIADVNEQTTEMLRVISEGDFEPTELGFADCVLSYLTSKRGDQSFLQSQRTGAM